MTIVMVSWILALLGLVISDRPDRPMAMMIVEKKLSRLTPIDCEKYVYHPQCRGLQAKKRLSFVKKSNMIDGDGNDIIVEDDKIPNICVCNNKITKWTPLMEKKKNFVMFKPLGRNGAFKERNDRKVNERRMLSRNVIMKNRILKNDDIKKEFEERKKSSVIPWKQKKAMDDKLNDLYVACIFV